MKHDDLRRQLSPDAPKKPRVLVPLLCGSIALHGLIWWAAARLPAPPARAPETLTEVQLADLPAPSAKTPAPRTTPTPEQSPRLALSPRAPRPAETPLVRPAQPTPPLPQLREVAPSAPLVRSERAVAQTGVIAKKPVAEKSIVPRPTAIPPARNPVPIPSSGRAFEPILPQPQNSAPATAAQPNEPAPLPTPDANASQDQKSDAIDPGQNSAIGIGQAATKGSDAGSGATNEKGTGSAVVSGTGEGTASGSNSRDAKSSSGAVTSKKAASNKEVTASKKTASKQELTASKDPAISKDVASGKSGGGLFGLGSGPFGIGGGASEGPRPNQTRSDNSPRAGAGQGSGAANDRGTPKNSGASDGSGADEINGAGGGPFGIGGDAGEGPRRIVYILDISYSMEPRFERAKQELRGALGGLQAGESFNIIAVYGNVAPFEPKLVEATPRNIDKGRAFIDSLRLKRYTNLEIAFEKAFAAPGVNVVVLITDGVPTYGLGSPDFSDGNKPDITANFGELAQRVRQLNRAGARIYTIGLTDKDSDKFEAAGLLRRIAGENGGSFKVVRIDEKP